MKLFLALMIFFASIALTGCWSSRELTELAITTALGIDKAKDGYKLTAQVINPGEIAPQSQTSRSATTTYTAEGTTMFEAIRKLTKVSPRKIYLAHLRVVLFSEELAREGIRKPLDVLSRDHEMRTDFAIAIAKGMTAEDQLKVLTPLEKVSANKIFTALEDSQDNWAPTKVVNLDELIGSLVSEGKEAVLTGIEIKGDPEVGNTSRNVETVKPATMVKISNLGVFSGDKLIEWLDEEESKGFNYITDNIKSTIGFVECDEGGTISYEVIKSRTKLSGTVNKKQPIIHIVVNAEGNIADVECPIDLSDPKTIEKLQKKYSNKTEEILKTSIAKAKELKTDIFGFGEVIARDEPKAWEKLKGNWNENFVNLEVEVNVHVKIRRLGTITDSFQKEANKSQKED